MEKKGLIGKIILSVLGILLIIGVGAGIYFYNYYVFKEIRICIGERHDSHLHCEVSSDCLNGIDYKEKLEGSPDFVKNKIVEIVNTAIYCNKTCFVRDVRGVNLENGEIEELEECLDGEEEFLVEIRGKEGLEILKWMKDKE